MNSHNKYSLLEFPLDNPERTVIVIGIQICQDKNEAMTDLQLPDLNYQSNDSEFKTRYMTLLP
jgi:hypothetical protein